LGNLTTSNKTCQLWGVSTLSPTSRPPPPKLVRGLEKLDKNTPQSCQITPTRLTIDPFNGRLSMLRMTFLWRSIFWNNHCALAHCSVFWSKSTCLVLKV
jgi:hypothetical protein